MGRGQLHSVRKYGYEHGYELAVSARENMLSLVEDELYVYDKVARQKAPGIAPKAIAR